MTQSERERAARQAEKLRANLQKRKQQKRARQVVEGDAAAVAAGVMPAPERAASPDSPADAILPIPPSKSS